MQVNYTSPFSYITGADASRSSSDVVDVDQPMGRTQFPLRKIKWKKKNSSLIRNTYCVADVLFIVAKDGGCASQPYAQ